MCYYGDIEKANAAAMRRVNDYREAAALIPAVNKIIQQFDRKVYNCRFDKALTTAIGLRIHVEKRYHTLAIYTYPENNYSHTMTLADISFNDMAEGKRIDANKMMQSSHKYREELLRKAYELETQIAQAPQIKEYIEQTIKKINKYLDGLSSDVKDIYGLPWAIRKS